MVLIFSILTIPFAFSCQQSVDEGVWTREYGRRGSIDDEGRGRGSTTRIQSVSDVAVKMVSDTTQRGWTYPLEDIQRQPSSQEATTTDGTDANQVILDGDRLEEGLQKVHRLPHTKHYRL